MGPFICAELLPVDGSDAVIKIVTADVPRVAFTSVGVEKVERVVDVVSHLKGEVGEIGQD